jgi:tetratricopeptide (TPR) repeat protein
MISRSRSLVSDPRISHAIQLAAGALILTITAVPLAAQRPAPAQRGGTPRADTPQLVVSALASHDPGAGAQAADAIRRRIQDQHTATDLYVVPQSTIDRTLQASGYNPDSALGPSDLVALAHQVRGDYALTGTVERTPSGVRTAVRLLTQRGAEIVAEPLSPIDGRDFGDMAKQVDRAVSEAIRALAFYDDCASALRAGDYQKAMAAAQQGLRIRPASATLELCVLSILSTTKASPDSLIAVASAITAVDPASQIAWANLIDAYDQKRDSVHALDAARMLHRIEPAEVKVTLTLVDHMVAAGQADSAVAVLESALAAAPASADLLRKKWLLDLYLHHFAAALSSGAALIAADSSAATEDYYERQLVAVKAGNDSASAHQLAAEASARFPKNADFLLLLAHDAADRGAAREAVAVTDRVLAIKPTDSTAWQLAIAAQVTVDSPDSAIATGRRALAAGVARDFVGQSLLAVVVPALKKAKDSHAQEDWQAVLHAAQAVDSVVSSAGSNYYIGLAAYQVASDEVQPLSEFARLRAPTRAQRQAACATAKQVDDLVSTSAIAMQKGGRVDPAVAGQILGALPGFAEFVGSVKRTSCRQ